MSDWLLVYDHYDPAVEGVRETLCTLGNGYFATRGAAPEKQADDTHYPGTYLAGCYDRLTSWVPDGTGGSARTPVDSEDLVNAPNWLPLSYRHAGGRWFDPDRPLSYRQELDMRRGVLTRWLRLRDGAGRVVRVRQRRIVSMDEPHLAALQTTITPENWAGPLEIRSGIDGMVTNAGVARYRDLDGTHITVIGTGTCGDGLDTDTDADADTVWLHARTRSARIEIAVAARTRVVEPGDTGGAGVRVPHHEPGRIAHGLTVDLARGQPVTIEKTVAIFTSRDRAIAGPVSAARSAAGQAAGFAELLRRHSCAWDRLWQRCRLDIEVAGAELAGRAGRAGTADVQRLLNLHVFHLLQTVSEHTVQLDAGVPARGLHGEGYRGHVFWDEVFILPFLTLRFPEIARALLMYRWRRLPAARQAARDAGHKGAMFPWQGGSDGREETPRLHLNPRSGRWLPDNSHLQRHVGLAVAHNVWRFYETTGDTEFLCEYGTEILVEVARFFADLTTHDPVRDRYEIRGVMGPDEYHDAYPGRARPGLDNNSYTNVMTVWVISRALLALETLPEPCRAALTDRLDLSATELARLDRVSRAMRVVFSDRDNGVIAQFEGYDDLAELDWAGYRERYGDIRRLDRILEAEHDTANRYQVSKQADVLMLFYLLSADELAEILERLGYRYDRELIPRTVEHYMARTAHGSTLSALVHAWVLARGDAEGSWRFFLETLHGDVDDRPHGTTAEGVHLGAMAGSLDLVQRCYAGVVSRDGVLHVDPRLPAGLRRVRLDLRYRGHWGIEVSCQRERVRVELSPGVAAPIDIAVGERQATIEPGGHWEVGLSADPATGTRGSAEAH